MSSRGAAQIGPDVAAIFQRMHGYLRTLIEDLDEEALAWRPGPEATPISNLVLHLLGAEANGFRVLLGTPRERDRDAEFTATPLSAAELVERVDAADRELEQLRERLTVDDLTAIRPRPARDQEWPGIQVLLNQYGHTCEHVAQIAFTRQLYQQRVT